MHSWIHRTFYEIWTLHRACALPIKKSNFDEVAFASACWLHCCYQIERLSWKWNGSLDEITRAGKVHSRAWLLLEALNKLTWLGKDIAPAAPPVLQYLISFWKLIFLFQGFVFFLVLICAALSAATTMLASDVFLNLLQNSAFQMQIALNSPGLRVFSYVYLQKGSIRVLHSLPWSCFIHSYIFYLIFPSLSFFLPPAVPYVLLSRRPILCNLITWRRKPPQCFSDRVLVRLHAIWRY